MESLQKHSYKHVLSGVDGIKLDDMLSQQMEKGEKYTDKTDSHPANSVRSDQ